jgi:hypothetical protein
MKLSWLPLGLAARVRSRLSAGGKTPILTWSRRIVAAGVRLVRQWARQEGRGAVNRFRRTPVTKVRLQ